MSFPKYPAYRDSGAEWLAEVPGKWRVATGNRLFYNSRSPATLGAEQLAATQAYGVIPQKEFMGRQGHKVVLALSGTGNFKEVKSGDFVISLRSFQGGLEYSAYDGCVSPAYTVLRPTVESEFHPRYFVFLLKAKEYIAALQSVTTGIREGRTITYEQFGSIPLPIPDADEQTQIARFLDHETARIDALIEEQQRLIKLLKEKRQAVISHAVTKGLDPTVPMKDSGVEWLGEVPAHWEVKPLRYLGQCQNGINIGGEAFGTGYPFVSYGDVYKNAFLPTKVSGLVESSESDRCKYSVRKGDLFFTRTSETVEEIGFSSTCLNDMVDAVFAGFLIRFRASAQFYCPEYFSYYFGSNVLRAFFNKEMNLVTRASLSQDLLKLLPVPVPSHEEQIEMADYLRRIDHQYSLLVDQSLLGVKILTERRSALISAAVTGKIDVRGWQSGECASPEPVLQAAEAAASYC